MTLDKVIVSLSHACAKPGVLFVALTRVRHPDNLLLEDDFPAFSTIRRQLYHPNFLARQKWERRMLVLFSRTVRKHMRSEDWFADDMRWTAGMSNLADDILTQWGTRPDLEGDAFLAHLLVFLHADNAEAKQDIEYVWKKCRCILTASNLQRFVEN